VDVPGVVLDAKARAARAGFRLSSEDAVGELLSVLAGEVPEGGRVLELGTGAGVGTAWIVAGLAAAGRSDVAVVTAESEPRLAELGRAAAWPSFVALVEGDVLDVLGGLGEFDLVFADAQGGKWEGLDRTVGVLRAGGVLVVDDMRPQQWWTDAQRSKQEMVRRTLLAHPGLDSIELDVGSGVILCTRHSE
jgi:demethylmenaquinone methyltransferase/2-methoxy-6-polyprenyl-1,4-benzoquinol methylase